MIQILLVLLLFFSSGLARAQTPDCGLSLPNFTAVGNSSVLHNVRVNGAQNSCSDWTLVYYSTGFSALSIEIDGAPDASGSPGTWVVHPATPTTGTNPSVLLQGTIRLSGYYPWIRVRVSSVTGTGSINGQLFGFRQNTARSGGGGGGGGTPAGSPGQFQINNSGSFGGGNLSENADGSDNSAKALTWAAPSSPTYNAAGTTTCNWSLSNVCSIIMAGGNTTLALTNPHGAGPYRIIWNQDTTPRTVTPPGSGIINFGPPGSGSGEITIQDFTYNGTSYIGSVPVVANSTWHGNDCLEGTAPSGVINHDLLWCDATTHTFMINANNAGPYPLTTIPVVASVGALPATCTVGQLAFVTAATAGQQLYECSARDVWTQQSGGGSTGQGPYSLYGSIDDTTGWSTVGAGSVSLLTTTPDAGHTTVRMSYTGANNNPQISARVQSIASGSNWTHAVAVMAEGGITRSSSTRPFGMIATNGTGYYYCGLIYSSGNAQWEWVFLKYASYTSAPSILAQVAPSGWNGYDNAPKYFRFTWINATSMNCSYGFDGRLWTSVATDSTSLITPTQIGYGFDPNYSSIPSFFDVVGWQ